MNVRLRMALLVGAVLLGVGSLFAATPIKPPALPAEEIKVVKDTQGWRLQIDGEDFEVKGVVWSYTPIGGNYSYNLWAQPKEFIQKVIDTDMKLISAMGANTIRVFSMVPPKWVEYIYDRYGIHTLVNDLFGRYGVTVDGRWQFPTNYADPATRRTLLAQAKKTFETYRNTRGVLMFMLGNESNYGLEWTSTAIENLPGGERSAYKAKALYSLFEEALALGKTMDNHHPMGLINGDLQYLNVLSSEVKSLDILGVNTYRGFKSYDNFYQSIKNELDKPFLYTEFGADAYNVVLKREDQANHAQFLKAQWQEVYEQAYGKGKAANCLGGYVFEWMDEWWKNGMDKGLDTHETTATWNNGAYEFDSADGMNNMNEEWFGLVAQSNQTDQGVNRRLPRAGYYLMKQIWSLPLYESSSDDIKKQFGGLDLNTALLTGQANTAHDPTGNALPVFELHGQLDMASFWKTDNVQYEKSKLAGGAVNWQGTTTQSVVLRPAEGLSGGLTLRAGTAAANAKTVDLVQTPENLGLTTPIEIYQGWVKYQSSIVDIDGYFHTGHADWIDSGDFFGIMPESFDLVGMDKGGSHAPFGVEIATKGLLDGLVVYGGPEIYWGASPRVTAKYFHRFGPVSLGLIYDQELAQSTAATKEIKTQLQVNNWTSLFGALDLPWLKVELGAMMARPDRVANGADTWTKNVPSSDGGYLNSGYAIYAGTPFTLADTLAGKIRLTSDVIPYVHLGVQYVYAGVLADTHAAIAREGSQLADIGTGNRSELLVRAGVTVGDFNLTGRFLWRAPLYDALPAVGTVVPRSLVTNQDQFIVWNNRKAIQGELILTYDPTGATYFYDWNGVDREDAGFSGSLGLLYNFYLGPTDTGNYLNATNQYADFTGPLKEVSNTWSLKAQIVTNPLPGLKIVADGQAGTQQSTGFKDAATSDRLVTSWGFRLRTIIYQHLMLEGSWLRDGWGPEDWYRQWNFTYPDQWYAGLAYGFKPISLMSNTDRVTLGITGRNYDSHANPDDLTVTGPPAYGVAQRLSVELGFGFSW